MQTFFLNIQNYKEMMKQAKEQQALLAKSNAMNKVLKDKPVSIPLSKAQSSTLTHGNLTAEGNVPFSNAQNKSSQTGLKVEINTKTHKVSNEKTEADLFFGRYYKGWEHFSEEKKTTFAKKYMTQFSSADKQAKEFKRLYKGGQSKENIQMFGKTLKVMKKDAQIPSVDTMLETKGEFRTEAGKAVAHNVKGLDVDKQLIAMDHVLRKSEKEVQIEMAKEFPNLNEKNQTRAAKLLAATKNEDVIEAGAQVAYKTNVKHQKEVAETFISTGLEKPQKAIALTEGKFDKKVQLVVYKSLMQSKHQAVLETAAKNIYTMDKKNQLGAVNMTMDTHNEGAINAAASQINKYDKSCRGEIKNSLSNSEFSSTKETIAKAESTPAEDENTTNSSETEASDKESATSEKQDLSEKIENISNSSSLSKDDDIKKVLESSTQAQQLNLLSTLSPKDALAVANILMEQNPSMEVLDKISDIANSLSEKDKNSLLGQLQNHYSEKLLTSNISLFDTKMQKEYVQEVFQNGNERYINKNKLSIGARDFYEKMLHSA